MKTLILILTSILLVACNNNSVKRVEIIKEGGYMIIIKDSIIYMQGRGDFKQTISHVYPIRDTIVHIYKCDTIK